MRVFRWTHGNTSEQSASRIGSVAKPVGSEDHLERGGIAIVYYTKLRSVKSDGMTIQRCFVWRFVEESGDLCDDVRCGGSV